jgi:hypothetical protein
MENPSVITAAVLAVCKQWHGSIYQQFSCINNVQERSERQVFPFFIRYNM